jgi:AsmA protein
MKRIGIVLAIVVAAVLIVLISVGFLLDANRYKSELESELSKVLGRDVKVGQLSFSILFGNVAVSDVAIGDDPHFAANPFLQTKSLQAGIELMPLIFSRRVSITGITIDNPDIVLIQSPSGAWNFSTLGATSSGKPEPPKNSAPSQSGASSSLDLSVKSVNINNGRLTLTQAGSRKKPLVLESVGIVVKDFSSASQFPFSLSAKVSGGGDIKLDGKAGPLQPADASMTPFNLTLKINGLDLAASGLNSIAPDISGVVSLDGTTASDGTTLKVDGHMSGEQLKLAKNGTASQTPVGLDFSDEHSLRKNSGVLQHATLHLGKSQATLTGTYQETPESVNIKTNLTGSEMAATDLAAIFPALGIVLPAGSSIKNGTLNVKLSSDGPVDKLITTGSLGLANFRLGNFDLGQKMAVIETVAGITRSPDMDVQTASTNVRVAPEGIAAQDIQLVVAGFGALSGSGTISPINMLDFKMNANVQAARVTSALGNISVPFTVEGSSSNPVFKPDVSAVAKAQFKKVETKALGGVLNNLLGGKKP